MQDKPIHIDDKFMNQAWSEMSDLLDRDMPVQLNKPRRWLGWFWISMLVSGLLICAGYVFFGKKTSAKIAAPTQPVAAASLPSFKGEQAEASLYSESTVSNEPAKLYPSKSEERLSNSEIQKSQLSKAKKQRQPKLETTQNTTWKETIAAISETESKVVGGADLKPIQALEPDLSKTKDVDKLPTISLSQLDFSSKKDFGVATFYPKTNGWDWALQTSLQSIPNFTGGGFSLETVASKPLITNRLSLEVGAGYSFLLQPIYAGVFGNASVSEEDEKIVYENADLAAFDVSNQGVTNVKSQGLKLHYLQFPVQFTYKIGKRYSANIGISTGILLSSRSKYTKDGILSDFAWAKQNEASARSASKVSTIDFAPTVGISFRFSPNSSLHLNYLHGLTDALPNNQVGDYNRMLKLGFRYKLSAGH